MNSLRLDVKVWNIFVHYEVAKGEEKCAITINDSLKINVYQKKNAKLPESLADNLANNFEQICFYDGYKYICSTSEPTHLKSCFNKCVIKF